MRRADGLSGRRQQNRPPSPPLVQEAIGEKASPSRQVFGGFRSMGGVSGQVFFGGNRASSSPPGDKLLPGGAHMVDGGDEGAEPGASRDNMWEPLLRDAAQRAVTPPLLTPPLLDAAWDPLSAAVATKQADAQQAQVRQRGS